MQSISSQIWLYKLFNSPYFDTWMAVSYLHRYPCIGIHKYICSKLEKKTDLELVLPQLVHIMFYHTNHIISFPIYNLLLKRSLDKKFGLTLFFHLKSFQSVLSQEKLYYCENLMAQILEKHKKPLLDFSKIKNKHNYLINRTKPFQLTNSGYLGLQGLLVYFVKSVSWNISYELTSKLNEYEDIFRLKRSFCDINLKFTDELFLVDLVKNFSEFKKNLVFLNELVEITQRLKQLPKHIQQISLEIELKQLNLILPAKIFLPFRPDFYIVNISITDSFVLDSAKNSPYVIVFELAQEIKEREIEIDSNTKTAIFLLNQLNKINFVQEKKHIKESILEKLESLTKLETSKNFTWAERKERIVSNSYFKDTKGFNIMSVIVKSGNDFKQELIAYQLLTEIKRILEEENRNIWLKNYKIYLIGNNSGLVETITNMKSIHNIKKTNLERKNFTLNDYFKERFEDYELAKQNFLISLVGYSLITYFLQLKDRHNGNILIDDDGHIIHVDFGFILGDHPGFYNVEKAPFKFSSEYLELLDNSLEEFKKLFCEGFLSLRKYSDRLCRILEMLIQNSQLKCININSVSEFRNRFKLDLSGKEVKKYVLWLVDLAFSSRSTGIYDHFQYFSNGYL